MGTFTKLLLFSVSGLFLLLALGSAIGGQWPAALGAIVFFTAIVYLGVVGWFASTLKTPTTDAEHVSTNLSDALKALAKTNPGWRAKVVLYGLPTTYLVMLGIRLWQLLR